MSYEIAVTKLRKVFKSTELLMVLALIGMLAGMSCPEYPRHVSGSTPDLAGIRVAASGRHRSAATRIAVAPPASRQI